MKTELKYVLKALSITTGSKIIWPPETNEIDEALVGETDFQNLLRLVVNNHALQLEAKIEVFIAINFGVKKRCGLMKAINVLSIAGFFQSP